MKQWIDVSAVIAAFFVIVISSGCEVPADYDIRGTWDYVQYHMDSLVYDNGTITFIGEPESGDWTQYNFYDVEYTGTYHVSETQVTLDGELEDWTGSFIDETHMEGNWQSEEDSGTWVAVMQ